MWLTAKTLYPRMIRRKKREVYRPYLTSPFKGRNKNLSLFGRKSPLKRGDLEGSFFPAKVVTSRTRGIYR